MSLYTYLKRKEFWINDFLTGYNMWRAYKDVKFLAENAEAGHTRRQKMLNDILEFARNNIPFYQNKDLTTLDTFPVINKSIIKAHKNSFVTPLEKIPGQKGELHIHKTSGSTGIPFAFPQDTLCRVRRIATIKYENDILGFQTAEPLMHLRSGKYYGRTAHTDFLNKKLNIWYIDNYSLTDERLKYIANIINSHKIKAIRGYATSLDFLTEFAVSHSINFPHHPIFISGGEPMPDKLRDRVVSSLGCHIITQYATEENGVLGSSYLDSYTSEIRLNKANCIIEILDMENNSPVADGKLGRVIVTDLTNYAMPMIRYDIGDIAAVGKRDKSSCLQTLINLHGRKQDMIFDTSGNIIDLFNNMPVYLEHNPQIKQFQFIQKSNTYYLLRLNTIENATINENKLISMFRHILGANALYRHSLYRRNTCTEFRQTKNNNQRIQQMKSMYNILVTGACGVTSRSVVKSLKLSDIFKHSCRFIGTDVCYNLYGVYEGLYEKVYKVPYSDEPNYREIMQSIIKKNAIDFAIVIPELEALYWINHPFDVPFNMLPPKFANLAADKSTLYKKLENSGLIPNFQIIKPDVAENEITLDYPLWMRSYEPGGTSGLNSFRPNNFNQLKAWFTINPEMKVAVSGITGNTSEGKLINCNKAIEVADKAVKKLLEHTSETMHGLVVADCKEDYKGTPYVTEINIRHNALTCIFAMAGLNFAESHLLLIAGKKEKVPPCRTMTFPPNNIFLRDVDGNPLYIPEYRCPGGGVDKW